MAPRIRCAIYTRKSSEEGMEQDFNSLDAQHEACAAFINSQKVEGWVLVQNRYDGGGISGGRGCNVFLKTLAQGSSIRSSSTRSIACRAR